jgi:SulP family sulfate permease
LIILVAYHLINLIPVASLAGVMFLVTYFTIEWESGIILLGTTLPRGLRERWDIHTKVKRSDVFIMLVVVTITLVLDLAVAVGCGIVMSCVIFSWDAGTRIRVTRSLSTDGTSVTYEITGPIFFGSARALIEEFPNPHDDPANVTILLEDAEIFDWSGMVRFVTTYILDCPMTRHDGTLQRLTLQDVTSFL